MAVKKPCVKQALVHGCGPGKGRAAVLGLPRLGWVVAVAATLVLLLSACTSSPDTQQSSTDDSTTTSSSTPTPPKVNTVPTPEGAARNEFTVYSGCNDRSNLFIPTEGEVFDTRNGTFVPLPMPPVAAGDVLDEQACTITSTEGNTLRVVYARRVTTPSEGLNPESQYIELTAADVASKKILATRRLPWTSMEAFGLRPAADGGVFLVEMCDNCNDSLVGVGVASFDAQLNQRAQLTQTSANDGEILVNYDGYAYQDHDCTVGQCLVEIFSGVDGSKIGEFSNAGGVRSTNHGFLLSHGGPRDPNLEGVYYFNMRTRETVGPIAPFPQDFTGSTANESYEYGDLLLLKRIGYSEDSFVVVYDTAAKKELINLDEQKIQGLKIEVAYLGGKYLYIENASDNPVIDVNTSQPVHSGWSLIPVAPLPNGWVAIHSGGPGASDTTTDKQSYVSRGASGVYDGPWF